LRLLLSTYAAEPGRGSEEGNGWNTIIALSKYHDVWALCTTEYQERIERHLADHPTPNVHWEFLDFPAPLISWRKPKQLERIHYYLWQHYAYGRAKALHDKIKFDACQHVTFGSYWRPSFLRRLGIPFLWGPCGGTENAPLRFYSIIGRREVIRDVVKRVVEGFSRYFDPTVRATARAATIGLGSTYKTANIMAALGCTDTRAFPQMALPDMEIEYLGQFPMHRQASPLRFLSLGRAVGWKGYELGVRAFAKFVQQYPDAEYTLVGDGDIVPDLRALANSLGIGDKYKVVEGLKRAQALEYLADSHIYLYPSIHNEPGWVVLEAMAAGRPVIFLRGMPDTPGADKTGIRVPEVPNADAAVEGLVKAMLTLAHQPDLRLQMGEAARAHMRQHFSWNVRAILYTRMYEEMLAERA
jgi:glycosyltransferase involved in cell wall biosynthesis